MRTAGGSACTIAWYAAAVIGEREFARLVHEAYAHLADRVFLREHQLTALLVGPSAGAVERLHRLLLDSIEQLRPLRAVGAPGVEWRRYRHLQARYRDGLTAEQIGRELGVSDRQARRDHAEALDQLARLLHRRLEPPPGGGAGSAPAAGPDTRPQHTAAADLEAELATLAAARGGATALAEAVRGVVSTAARLAAAHRVAVETDVAETLPSVQADRTMLRQVLLTLLSDAIVRHPGGRVSIGVVRCEGAVDLRLIAEAGWTEVIAHPGGEIEGVLERVRQLGRGQGMEAEVIASGRAEWIVAVRMAPAAVRTLLLVDDNPDVALLFRRFLGETAYRVVQARSADRALRLAAELQPEVVFLDLLMPLADGWEILQALRADPTTRELRVVICSVMPDPALARSFGVTELLPKPVTRPALLALLAGRADPAAGGRGRPGSSASAPRPSSLPAG